MVPYLKCKNCKYRKVELNTICNNPNRDCVSKSKAQEMIESKETKQVSTSEALKDVERIDWSDDVVQGKRKVVVDTNK